MNYYRIHEGVPQAMPQPKNISNPSATTLAALAKEGGYKEMRQAASPSAYHTRSYREYDTYIREVWTKPELAELKAAKKREAEAAKEAALRGPTPIEVEGVGIVQYDADAEINVMGLSLLQPTEPVPFILADDTVVQVTVTQIQAIAGAIAAHKQGVYASKAATFAAIEAATDVDDLL